MGNPGSQNGSSSYASYPCTPTARSVQQTLPSLEYEISETGKCLALGRSTASVFHSIRCLEASIRALARCLRLPDPTTGAERNWNIVLYRPRFLGHRIEP